MPRLIALILALGGTFWGIMLLGTFGPWILIPLPPFGIGYVVTAGYIWRAVTTPTYKHRRGIWILSIIVQGCWLLIALADLPQFTWFTAWWLFATTTSIIALYLETKEQLPNTPGV